MSSECRIESADSLRPPGVAMRLARLGAHFATRLSFSRVLIRDLIRRGATIDRPVHDLDADGYGVVVYRVRAGEECYCLVCFSTALAPEQRTDRVIAEAWDASFVLTDGQPDVAELARLRANAPLQEAGRFTERDIVLSRANRSVRLFEHVVARLAEGLQPDAAFIRDVGYLMRTTAVYGNGKFGLADRARIAERPLLRGAFRPEMLTVYLIRLFTHELVDHVAAACSPSAATLAPAARRALGIGNATGLGMAPFVVRHAQLFNNWMLARETALARVLSQPGAGRRQREVFIGLLERVREHLAQWHTDDPRQHEANAVLATELATLAGRARVLLSGERPWAAIAEAVAGDSLQMQELAVSLVMEPNGELVDGLAQCCDAHEIFGLDPATDCGTLLAALRDRLRWALGTDLAAPGAQALFWYVSEEKLEPRLGRRDEEPGAEREMPLALVRDYQALERALARAHASQPVGEWLAENPGLRHVVMRVQSLAAYPYADIRDNLVDEHCLPIDLLRCKLAMFGASRFDPKSDRWTRITLFHGAPLPHALTDPGADDWSFAVVPDDLVERSPEAPLNGSDGGSGAPPGNPSEPPCVVEGMVVTRPSRSRSMDRSGPAIDPSGAAAASEAADALDLSCGEFESLVVKAALGAGLTHGHALELAVAATTLAAAQRGLAADAVLAALLEAESLAGSGVCVVAESAGASGSHLAWRLGHGSLVSVIPAALDLACSASGAKVNLPQGLSLAWLAAYIGSRPLPRESRLVVTVAGTSQEVPLDKALAGVGPAGEGGVIVASVPGQPWRAARGARVRMARPAWRELQSLAMRTTVPSSALSRSRGAGAEIDDSL